MRDERGRLAAMPAGLVVQPRPLGGLGGKTRTRELRGGRQDNPAADRGRPVAGAGDAGHR
jgi:hypothetical protein